MKGQDVNRTRRFWTRGARFAALATVVGGASQVVGCLDRPIEPIEPRTTSTIVERLTQSSVDKIDLLLALDNSRSMADKQAILALAVPDLVSRLVNPICVDPAGAAAPPTMQPANPTDACPPGTVREFDPILDIHIGVISSSIGSAGADACIPGGGKSASVDDHGHLLARLKPDVAGDAPTYQGKGFLAWDPNGKLVDNDGNPVPGESSKDNLITNLSDMVVGVGQVGCGYEAQLESWYRFLVDPEPYKTISIVDGKATPDGLDETLLAQRADFLRPDSLLAIVMLTDENDCSIKESGQYYFAAQLQSGSSAFHLPRARSECATNPNDPCCKSCGQDPGSCPADPNCATPLAPEEDDANLRCWDQKRRFGIDFLYGTDRYVHALQDVTIPNRAGQLVNNPLFSDLNPQDDISNIRDQGLVFFAGIVGVPWQDIARDPSDLTKGFKNSDELQVPDGNGLNTWDVILGNPAEYVPPKDPLMLEGYEPRSGSNPITGDAIAPPGSPNGTNPINGHEYTIAARDELQYACIFPLLQGTERDCGPTTTEVSCDCGLATNDNPLCEPNPNDNGNPTLQVRAKAYPGIRELSVLRGVSSQGIVASVCPKELINQDALDFGYRPAIGAIIDRLKTALGGQCLPRTLTPDDEGHVSCLILEARKEDGQCVCDPNKARQDVSTEHKAAMEAAKADPFASSAGWNCFCEITQLSGEELKACQTDLDPAPVLNGETVDGWCYIDATTSPPTGNPEIVEKCPDTERRLIRFVGEGEAQPGGTLFITCSGE